MERNLSILMVAAEAHPLAKVGGLADVMGALPPALSDQGHDVRLALPFYKSMKGKVQSPVKVKGAELFDVALGDKTYQASVWKTRLPQTKIEVYLIENSDFFDRDGIYVDAASGEPYPDDAERFTFFSRAVLRLVKRIDFDPDIVHCHDHQTGFMPAWLKYQPTSSGLPEGLRTVFTIHNLAYQGDHPKEIGYKAGFGEEMLKPGSGIGSNGRVNMMKAGIAWADTVTTVSPTYAKEIQTAEFGYGLEEVLRGRAKDLVGILNGADYSVWNPEHDGFIPCKYSLYKPDGKQKCRQHLIERLNLKVGPGTPLVGMVSRLVSQKGFDILSEAFDRLMELDLGFVVLGLGEKRYHEALTGVAAGYPGRVSVNLAFDEQLAHQIEAGCDMFLMPSRYEPCGLNQMYSMKYGTIPIVRATGGLADSVTDYMAEGESTGFVFEEYSAEALCKALERARKVFADGKEWAGIVRRAMAQDFSWGRAAQSYAAVYLKTLRKRSTEAGA
jgi:starch synthase